MKNNKIKLLFLAILALVMSFSVLAFTACDSGDDGSDPIYGKHVVDPNGMGGENVLDDGGKINISDPVYVPVGVATSGEKKIIISENRDKYELAGGAVDTATWSNNDCTVNRIRCSATDQVIFTFDFTALPDTSKTGCMLTLINNRTYTCISVSVDKKVWKDIGYADEAFNGIKSDYSTVITDMLGKQVSDGNLYQCYYGLGEYVGSSKIIYVRCGQSDQYYTGLAGKQGTDIIGYVSSFDSLEVEYDYL